MKTSTLLWTKLSLLCIALVLVLGGTASAVTYTVGTTSDFAITTVNPATGAIVSGADAGQITLRSAVIAANMSGVGPHTINVPAGTYNLSQTNPNTPGTTATAGFNDLQIGSHLSTVTITGTGAAPQIVQTVAGNDVLTTGFKADGSPAIVNLTLNNLDISGGSFTGIFTGADDATNRSSTTITNCNIHNNTNGDATSGQGGAIFNQAGSLSISGTTFANNSATNAGAGQGGAIFYNLPNAAGATGVIGSLSVTNCIFNTNTSAIGVGFPAGGAMFIDVKSDDTMGGAINISGCTFNGNTATGGGDGGAIAVLDGTTRTLNITQNNFISNQVTNAAGRGGAISMSTGIANINFNRFSSNSATTLANGQAIFHGNADAVNANDNWWLSNTGPAANSVAGAAVTLANFLQLKLSSSPTNVISGGTSTLTSSFLSDSANNVIAPGNLTQLVGRAVSFGSDALGSTSGAQPSIQAAGTATATFTAGTTAGVSTTSALVDGVTATAGVTIQPTVTLNATSLPITATTITIGGTGFSLIPGNNSVAFTPSGTGTVTGSTATTLTVTSLAGLAVGPLNAVVTTNAVNSGAPVQVATVTALSITPSVVDLAQNAPTIVINGNGFSTTLANNTVVFSNGAVGHVTAASATQLTVTFDTQPTGTGVLNATVSVVGNGSTGPTQVATVVAAPTVTPNNTHMAINAPTILIAGTGFSTTPASNSVAFNNGAAGGVTAATSTQLTVTFSTPPNALGSLTAVVTSNGGNSGAPVQVAIVDPVAPSVGNPTLANLLDVSATLGGNVTSEGGASLSARGVVYAKTADNANPLIGGANVTVVNDAANTTGVFAENISGLSPSTGYSFVAFATNSVGTTYTSPVSTFTTLAPLPTPTSILPVSGTEAGGTPVTITGSNFTGATGVTIGGVAATGFLVVNDTTITATTAAHAVGVSNVVVTGPTGTGTGTNLYAYVAVGVLFDNGPFVTHPKGGAGGTDDSRLQSGLGMTTFGASGNAASFRLSDGFTVPAGQTWTINDVAVFGYQTGSTTTSSFTSLTLRIWDGPPNIVGSNVVFGDTTTNRLASSTFYGVYRTTSSTGGNTQRPIMRLKGTVGGLSLSQGTYWLDWGAAGSIASGPFFPPITIAGQTTTGDALQQTVSDGTWAAVSDVGPQGMPFLVLGTSFTPPLVTTNPSNALVNEGATATFTAAATGNPVPTVQWQVSTNGGANFTDIPAATSIPLSFTAAFSQNQNQYRAVFTNVLSSATTTAATLTVNRLPLASPVGMQRFPSQPVKLSVAQLFTLGAVSDPDPLDTVALQSVSVPANGTAQITGGFVLYTPNAGFLLGESFSYTVADGRGGTATSTVTVSVITDNNPTNNITKFTKVAGSPAVMDFVGIPGLTYGVQYKLNMADLTWLDIGPVTVDQFGAVHFTDNGPGSAPRTAAATGFYRFVFPAP